MKFEFNCGQQKYYILLIYFKLCSNSSKLQLFVGIGLIILF